MQIRGRNLLDHLEKQVGLVQLSHKLVKPKMREDLAGILRKTLDILQEVALDVRAPELREIHRRSIVKLLLGGPEQELLARRLGLLRLLLGLLQNLVLGRLEHTLEPPQHSERENDPPVLTLLEVAAEKIS